MDNSAGRKVGLLGGSFDPVHNGHLAIAQSFLNSGYISELWVLLTPDPPHKTDKNQTTYHFRLEMLRSAFQDFDRVTVKEIEKKLPRPSYTVKTLQYLKDKYPNTQFYLCLGEDSARQFTEWRNWEAILNYCDLLVARRPVNGNDSAEFEIDDRVKPHLYFIDHQKVDISSTEIRQRLKNGKAAREMLPSGVIDIINEHHLYQNQ